MHFFHVGFREENFVPKTPQDLIVIEKDSVYKNTKWLLSYATYVETQSRKTELTSTAKPHDQMHGTLHVWNVGKYSPATNTTSIHHE